MAHSGNTGVTGAVLVGGKSKRMGCPKAQIRIPGDGPSMLDRVIRSLQTCVDEIFLVGTAACTDRVATIDLQLVVDDGTGPTGGLIAALRASGHPRVLLVPCDVPFLSAEVLRHLMRRSLESGRGVFTTTVDSDGTELLQPMPGIYLKDQLEEIERLAGLGEQSLVGIVNSLGMTNVPQEEILAVDPQLWSFFNVNTPSDVKVARRHAAEWK